MNSDPLDAGDQQRCFTPETISLILDADSIRLIPSYPLYKHRFSPSFSHLLPPCPTNSIVKLSLGRPMGPFEDIRLLGE